MIRKNKNRPLYREVVRDALLIAWHERRLWPFAILAGILQTGGIADVVIYAMRQLSGDSQSILASAWGGFLLGDAFSAAGWIQGVLLSGLIVGAILTISVVSQGALVYGLGARIRGRIPTWRQCLTVGARNFSSIVIVNIVTLGLIWIARFLMLVPYAFSLSEPTALTVVTYFFSALLFLLASVALTTMHLFAVNAIVLQDAPAHEALVRAYETFKQHWLITIETAGILLGVGAMGMILALFLFTLLAVPLFLFLVAAELLQITILLQTGYVLGFVLFFGLMFLIGAYTITFQYAAWGKLYRRMGEGGAMARIHRWLHWLFDAV
jgi:hypothetical protein